MLAYKIMLDTDTPGAFRTLMHGIDRTRNLHRGRWYEAENKMRVDGSGQEPYRTGVHVFPSLDKATSYLQNFRTEVPRVIVSCWIKSYRTKPTNDDVLLADRFRIIGRVTNEHREPQA